MRNARDYTHQLCQTETEISGPEFRAMSDPLADMKMTYCTYCDDHFPVNEFAWSDTNELISAYYARHRKRATSSDMWWCGNAGLFLLASLGLLAGIITGILLAMATSWLVGLIVGFVLALIGAITGMVVREKIVCPQIYRRVWGIADTRSLR